MWITAGANRTRSAPASSGFESARLSVTSFSTASPFRGRVMRIIMLARSCSRISLGRCGGSCCLLVLWLMMLNLTVRADQAPPQNAPPPQNPQQPQNARQAEYVVGPNDILGITVYDQPQLSRTYSVQADGSLTFPLIGRVKVGGLSAPAIESELRQRLSQGFLKSPQVGVIVEQYRSQQIFVIGEVR